MATKRKKASFTGYALSHLTPEVQAQVKNNIFKPADLLQFVQSVVDDGYKFALQFNDDDGAYQASLYGQWVDGDNPGLMLSMRHSDMLVAVTALSVIHSDVYQGEWLTQSDFDW